MSENLRRGYGGFLIFPSEYDVRKVAAHMYNASSPVETTRFYFKDSDTYIIYEGFFDSDGQLVSKKVGYDYFDVLDSEYQTDLMNAYGIDGYVVGVDEATRYGQLLRDSDDKSPQVFLFKDSENAMPHFWRRRKEFDGSDSEHYIKRQYLHEKTQLGIGEFRSIMKNQYNFFNLFDISGSMLNFYGKNLIKDSDDTTSRKVRHIESLGEVEPGALFVYREGEPNIEITGTLGGTTYSSRTDWFDSDQKSDGALYTGFKADTNNKISFFTSRDLHEVGYKIRYITEFSDSETPVDVPAYIDSEFGSFVPVIYNGNDSEFHDVSFSNTQEDTWRVFDDSDNLGFLGQIGDMSGGIGWKNNLRTDIRYVLKRVIITNTPASQVQQWPRDFNIDGYDALTNTWTTIYSVSNQRSFVYDSEVNIINVYDGFRVYVTGVQPDFDPVKHAIEIKQIDFQVEKRTYYISRTGKAFFADENGKSYLFKTGEEEILINGGILIGGGGGGGSSSQRAGAGGGGGGYCRIKSVTLKPQTVYQLGVGIRGPLAGPGGDTYLRDITNGVDVIRVTGGQGGAISPAGNPVSVGTTARTPGGTITLNNVDYTIDAETIDGGEGGAGTASSADTAINDGSSGVYGPYYHWTNDIDFYGTHENYNVCAGGGGGIYHGVNTSQAGEAGGPSAGRGVGYSPSVPSTAGVNKRGGGGGGCGLRNGFWSGGSQGGSGYACLIFG